jgi:hypothetical protein
MEKGRASINLYQSDKDQIGTTEFDIFSLNPGSCTENRRTHEVYPPSLLPANRGTAYMDGILFRGVAASPAISNSRVSYCPCPTETAGNIMAFESVMFLMAWYNTDMLLHGIWRI